eukprot:2033256-Pleurochrysis_carterae.AAC.1
MTISSTSAIKGSSECILVAHPLSDRASVPLSYFSKPMALSTCFLLFVSFAQAAGGARLAAQQADGL